MKNTILLVEERADISHFICDSLKQKNYETMQVKDGISAIEILKYYTKIDLLLINFPLADISYFEFLTQMKALSIMVPLLFMVTELTEEMIKSDQYYQMIGWIKKPYRAENFFAHIENALR